MDELELEGKVFADALKTVRAIKIEGADSFLDPAFEGHAVTGGAEPGVYNVEGIPAPVQVGQIVVDHGNGLLEQFTAAEFVTRFVEVPVVEAPVGGAPEGGGE